MDVRRNSPLTSLSKGGNRNKRIFFLISQQTGPMSTKLHSTVFAGQKLFDLGFEVHLKFKVIRFLGEVTCEPPNNRLDKFQGKLEIGDERCSLDNSNIVLRV